MGRKIYQSWFFKSKHKSNNGKVYFHPFLAIRVKEDKVVDLQFISANYNNDYSDFVWKFI